MKPIEQAFNDTPLANEWMFLLCSGKFEYTSMGPAPQPPR